MLSTDAARVCSRSLVLKVYPSTVQMRLTVAMMLDSMSATGLVSNLSNSFNSGSSTGPGLGGMN